MIRIEHLRKEYSNVTPLMIVTHEMAFARAICNRVFYMDEGGIYEDGTPEQVFDNPVREKTRRFVHRLKVLELSIESRDYGTTISSASWGRLSAMARGARYRCDSCIASSWRLRSSSSSSWRPLRIPGS
jgi:ABC-type methionine transport system ATPase subunit